MAADASFLRGQSLRAYDERYEELATRLETALSDARAVTAKAQAVVDAATKADTASAAQTAAGVAGAAELQAALADQADAIAELGDMVAAIKGGE